MTNQNLPRRDAPWWRHPIMWMVVGGPAVVVVAAVYTAWLAMRSPDPVVEADYYRRGIEINRTLSGGTAMLPAQAGRNHAMTPADDLPHARHARGEAR
ncbi:MAG: nitrogen fixation protein FixH [Variovorax paradoxus]|uniref:Nitrogen fixation protein FixH n=1 Tax=Variovorax paradoxus TaxID=34073 RepID=A0A2W5RPB7_VARPD|nr:MAG: nitrogen fixation protein FixH [Variovorax paradoxus]